MKITEEDARSSHIKIGQFLSFLLLSGSSGLNGSSLFSGCLSGASLFSGSSLFNDRLEGVFGAGFVGSGSWVVDGSGVVNGMVGTMVGKTVVGETMVGKTMVGKRVGNGCVDRDVGGSMDTCNHLLLIVVLVNLIRGSSGLGVHN